MGRTDVTRLIGLLTAATVAGASLVAGAEPGEAVTPAQTTLTTIPSDPYRLSDNGTFDTYGERIAGLETRVTQASAAEVFADANREARGLCHATGVTGATGFCWNSGDDGTPEWYPQGITASWDATGDGSYAGHRAILVSWYNTDDKGVRVSFVDYDDPAAPRYRHVLLVEPTSTDDFRAVNIHAGGLAWYGDHLYVVDTSRGIRVFDLRTVWRTEGDASKDRIGLGSDGRYYAHDYRYVVPQVGAYTQTGGCVRPPDSLDQPLCYSYLAVDRSTSPPSLLTGEYYDGVPGARLVRWPLDTDTGLLTVDSAGTVAADAAYRSPHTNLQGAVSHDDTFLMVRSRGRNTGGLLYRGQVGVASSSSALPIGPEDISYEADSGRAWTHTEYPGSRVVFSVPDAMG